MKFLHLFLIVFFVAQVHYQVIAQQDKQLPFHLVRLDSTNLDSLKWQDTVPRIYEINRETLYRIFRQDSVPLAVLYTFHFKCGVCLSFMPVIYWFLRAYRPLVRFYPLVGYNTDIELKYLNKKLIKLKYREPFFLIQRDLYSPKHDPFKRIGPFIKELCPGCDTDKMGYSTFIVIDTRSLKVLYAPTWEIPRGESMRQLERILQKYRQEYYPCYKKM